MHFEKRAETENILDRLKRETEEAHRETERYISFAKPKFSVTDYISLLIRFYAFYRAFEPQIEAAIKTRGIDFNYQERLKTPKIRADLHSLGINEQALSEIAGKCDLPVLDSAEKAFGALYVVEGSTLGGQVISRHLKAKFGFDETRGAAFFSGYGAQTGKMWNDFRAAILEFADKSLKHDEIIDAATETFEKVGFALGGK